jgi:hypothetical protein
MEKLFAFACLYHIWVDVGEVRPETRNERDARWRKNGWSLTGFNPESGYGGYMKDEVLQEVEGNALVVDPYLTFVKMFRDEGRASECDAVLLQKDESKWLQSQIRKRSQDANPAFSIARDLIQALSYEAEDGDVNALEQLRVLGVEASAALELASEKDKKASREVASKATAWPVSLEFNRRPYGHELRTREGFLQSIHLAAKALPESDRTTRKSQSISRSLARELKSFVSKNSPEFEGQELTEANRKSWWAECLTVFKRAYPSPETIDELKKLCDRNDKKESLPQLRAAIRSAIQRSFMRLVE